MNPLGDPPLDDRRPRGYPLICAAGGDLFACWDTFDALYTARDGGEYRLLTRGPAPLVLFAAPSGNPADESRVNWLDFTIELIAGLLALMTGVRIGKDGYKVLKPVTELLWEDPGVRERVTKAGSLTQSNDPAALGAAVVDLWKYLWANHRRSVFKGFAKAVGASLGPRALLEMLVRWMARLVSAGTALLVEIGLLAMPLGRKVRGELSRITTPPPDTP